MTKVKRMRNKARDRAVFENTANKIHKQNLDKKYTKGGIRLWNLNYMQ